MSKGQRPCDTAMSEKLKSEATKRRKEICKSVDLEQVLQELNVSEEEKQKLKAKILVLS